MQSVAIDESSKLGQLVGSNKLVKDFFDKYVCKRERFRQEVSASSVYQVMHSHGAKVTRPDITEVFKHLETVGVGKLSGATSINPQFKWGDNSRDIVSATRSNAKNKANDVKKTNESAYSTYLVKGNGYDVEVKSLKDLKEIVKMMRELTVA